MSTFVKFKEFLATNFDKAKAATVQLWTWSKANKLQAFWRLCLILAGLALLFILSIYLGLFGRLPSTQELKEIKNPLATTIYSGDKEIIGYFYVQNRSNIDSAQVNDYVKNALVATEDIRFYEHSGIDWRSLGRVFVKTLLMRKKSSGGGSTITQQLAKNVFGRKKQYFLSTPINKIREMFIAKRLEKAYTKDEILLLYLNTVPFGERLYGIEKAAQRFFNKKPEKLTLDEAAIIVGILKASTYYNPNKNPENSLRRRNVVMGQMLKYNFIDTTTFEKFKEKPIKLDYTLPKAEATYAGHFKDLVRKEFEEWAANNPKEDGTIYDLDIDGLKIHTTLHNGLQKAAEKAVESRMKDLQKYFETGWDSPLGKDIYIENVMKRHPLYKQLKKEDVSQDSIKEAFNKKTLREYWNGIEIVRDSASILDSMLYELTTLQAGVVAIHNSNGKIMVYIGGRDYGYSQYDNVQLPKQVGSTFKPIAYLGALGNGVDPCDYFDNTVRTYKDYEDWTPKNADGSNGGSYSVYGALAKSINTVSVQMIFKAGVGRVIELARSMGITSKLPKVPSLVLGTAEIPLIQMVSAYGGIANNGTVMKPYCITKIEDENGKVIYEAKAEVLSQIGASSEDLEVLRKMMTYVHRSGTGSRIYSYNIPYTLIGKTGTTQNNADGWYIASSPEIVCGSWVGTMDPSVVFKSTAMGSGANTALPIVASVFANLSAWKSSVISDFTFNITDFPCLPYTDMNASAADSLAMVRPDTLWSLMNNILFNATPKDSTANTNAENTSPQEEEGESEEQNN